MTETAAASDPRPTVLLFEDEAMVALLVESLLAEAGYRVVWTADGEGALPGEEPSGIAPCAAVVDLRLAWGLDGRDVLRRLRDRHPGMPALVVTGYDPLAPEADLRGLGGPTLRLRKPFDCEEFIQHLAVVLGAAATPAAWRRRASDFPARGIAAA
jgi:DNA-binding response OmpR family regulator